MMKKIASRLAFVLSAALSSGAVATAVVGVAVGVAGCKSGWKAGDAVDVEWKGSWWKGEILEAKGGDQYKIHYVGWSSSWDEVVPKSRLRARTAGSQQGTEKK